MKGENIFMGVLRALTKIKKDGSFRKNITHVINVPPKEAVYSPLPSFLDGRLNKLLAAKNIKQLYLHQGEALKYLQKDEHIVVVTPTASGKTLCYNLPVLNKLLKNKEGRALYIFPTKALAQDQVSLLSDWTEEMGGEIKVYTYDGDTPVGARRSIRLTGNIVITNPDMLHAGILPHHTKWVQLFENLQFIVIDEIHIYRGVFGSHVANVLRRLKRICEFYGAKPQFICTSATVANPGEHAANLMGHPVKVIDENGSPQGPKEIIFYNPPVVNRALGVRRSSVLESQKIAAAFINEDVQTIVFARSRLQTEVLVTYLRRYFRRRLGQKQDPIRGYRGGYLPKHRRRIEKDLRDKEILAVVSTNALELGIDVGSLEAVVLTGYPGTIASTWQQIGRAGRGLKPSAAVLVASASPLNQFIINNPQYFLSKGSEHALINPNNMVILAEHIKCAAYELPFTEGEAFGDGKLPEILEFFVEKNILHKTGRRWYWMSDRYPADGVSLRSAAADNVVILDLTRESRVIGEVDKFSAPMLVHEGAIYLHESKQFHIERLDFDRQKAYAREVDVDYYTDANLAVDLKVLDVLESEKRATVSRAFGEVLVSGKVSLYKKIKFFTHENVGWGDINLPEQEMHTHAYWMSLQQEKIMPVTKDKLQSALLGVANLLQNIAPLELMCDPRDIRVFSQVKSPFTQEPAIYLYESYPGGVGFSEKLFLLHDRLLVKVADALAGCSCPLGCPSCVGPIEEVGRAGKANAHWLLTEVLGYGHKK